MVYESPKTEVVSLLAVTASGGGGNGNGGVQLPSIPG